jgi:glucokinase
VRLVNDFSALAAATECMHGDNLLAIGGGSATSFHGVATTAIIGPGTGLGVGGLVRGPAGALMLTTEGGHSTFAPNDEIERKIVRVLGERFDHISNERLLSGDGLRNIHWALSRLAGGEPETLRASEISRRAKEKSDRLSSEAVGVFSRALGAFAGDVVLTLGARNGLYVAGGMIPAIIDSFDRAAFRDRFEAKGRFRAYMEQTPVWLMVHLFAALVGVAALAESAIA